MLKLNNVSEGIIFIENSDVYKPGTKQILMITLCYVIWFSLNSIYRCYFYHL